MAVGEKCEGDAISVVATTLPKLAEHITGKKIVGFISKHFAGESLSPEHAVRELFRHSFNEPAKQAATSWMPFIENSLKPNVVSNDPSKLKLCFDEIENGLKQHCIGKTIVSSVDVIIWTYCYALWKSGINFATNNSGIVGWLEKEIEWLEVASMCLKSKPQNNQISPPTNPSTVSLDSAVSREEMEEAQKNWLNLNSGFKQIDKRVLVTSALPYVNNVPHLGNLVGSVLSADVFARFARKCFTSAIYICGTDEYGTTTETKALEEKCTPQEICDKYFKIHKSIYDWFDCKFDHFGRTSTAHQTRISQSIFSDLHANGYICEEDVQQPYCSKCQRFLADRFVEGKCPLCSFPDARGDQCDGCGRLLNAVDLREPRCKICRSPPSNRASKHMFLDLPKLEPLVSAWYEKSSKAGYWTATAKAVTEKWLKEGLKPRCITRDLCWGTPVPRKGYENKVFYVWFDAPIGYLSITAQMTEDWECWWKNPDQVEMFQFMAKDNVPFHSIVFPCSLLGTGKPFTLVNHLSGIDYLMYENSKFSKSRGIGVFCDEVKNLGIPPECWRYYLMASRPETQDSNFNWDDFMLRCNSELLNNLGNFVNRCLTFCNKSLDSTVYEFSLVDELSVTVVALINRELEEMYSRMSRTQIREALKHLMNISRIGNQYLQQRKPWDLLKTDSTKSLARSSIALSVNIVVLLALICEPYMPAISTAILKQCNMVQPTTIAGWPLKFVRLVKPGHRINLATPLFKRLEPDAVEALRRRHQEKQ